MVNNIKAILTWGLLLVSSLDIGGDKNVIFFFLMKERDPCCLVVFLAVFLLVS